MPARFGRQAAPVREERDHLVPAAPMKAVAVREQQSRIFTRPIPHGKVHAIDREVG
jgi:hypothetical protein